MRRFFAQFILLPLCSFAFSQGTTKIDVLSVTSLALAIFHNQTLLGSATGFVVQKNRTYYLITNRHVVLQCAEDKDTNDVGGWICADKLRILHNKADHLGEWFWVQEDLYDGSKVKRWLEHPTLGASADLIAIPLNQTSGVAFYPLNLDLQKTSIVLTPGDSVNIVGFPFGNAQVGGLAIWKIGTVASDLDINYGGKAKFLVDTTARPGMSGSPVYARRSGAYQSEAGMTSVGTATKFLGVYSEENQMAELGAVWKAEVVAALYDSLP
jgi:V8-like Glu-specific endopeptidase